MLIDQILIIKFFRDTDLRCAGDFSWNGVRTILFFIFYIFIFFNFVIFIVFILLFFQIRFESGHLGGRCDYVYYALRFSTFCQVSLLMMTPLSLRNMCLFLFSMSNNQEELFQTILSGNYDFPRPYWNHISSAAKVSTVFFWIPEIVQPKS